MLAASPALFPSAASAKPQQNNPAPVTERQGGKQRESQRQKKGGLRGGGGTRGPNLQGNIRLLRYASVPFLSASPRVLIQIARRMMVMPSIHSVPSSPKQPPFMVTQTYFPSQLELKSGQL